MAGSDNESQLIEQSLSGEPQTPPRPRARFEWRVVRQNSNRMMLAHATAGSMNWILTANLLVLWFIGIFLAMAVAFHGFYVVFEERQTRYAFIRGAFPFAFGVVSFIWFYNDPNLRGSSWWFCSLAAASLLLGLALILGSFGRRKP